jgi:hypothetical protein
MPPPTTLISRAALIALALLMVPLVASRLVDGWNWPPGTFVFAYLLFFGTALAYGLIAARFGAWAYKAAVALALITGFALGWSNMVHLSESENPANLSYFGVLLIGAAGAWLARLQPRGLSRVLFTMAALLTLLSILLASAAPSGFEHRAALGHGIAVALFAASGLLFRHASLNPSK